MALVPIPGLAYSELPDSRSFFMSGSDGFDNSKQTLNGATKATHMVGKVFWRDRATHTLSSSGGKVGFRTEVPGTFVASAGQTTLRVGLQALSTSAGPPARGDGSWLTYHEYVSGTDSIVSNTFYDTAMTVGSGISLAHGATIAAVVEMTTHGGSDSVGIFTLSSPADGQVFMNPTATFFDGTNYTYTRVDIPMLTFTSDEGVLGTFYGTYPVDGIGLPAGTMNTGSGTTKEQANLFSLPFPCRIDGIFASYGDQAGPGGGIGALYTNPLTAGSVTEVASGTFTARSGVGATEPQKLTFFPFDTSYDYTVPGTVMAMAVRPSSTDAIELSYFEAPTAALLDLHPLGQTCRAVSRGTVAAGTAFATFGSTKRRMIIGLIISDFDNGQSAGGGGASNSMIVLG